MDIKCHQDGYLYVINMDIYTSSIWYEENGEKYNNWNQAIKLVTEFTELKEHSEETARMAFVWVNIPWLKKLFELCSAG